MIICNQHCTFNFKANTKATRSNAWEKYLQEAFGCKECSVIVENIGGDGISRIRRGLIRPQRTVRMQLVDNPAPQNQLSPRSQRRNDDLKFKPPVPLPVKFVEVGTLNAECEL